MPCDDLTVVIPAFRAERTIKAAIGSICVAADAGPKIIVVVDGGLDRTEEIVRAYRHDRMTIVVNDRNRGGQYSRNRGLALVQTEYVMFLDSDDYVSEGLVDGLLESARRNEADLTVGPWRAFFEATGRYGKEFVPDFTSPEDLFYRWLGRGQFVPPCAVLWRTAFVRSIGGWDPDLKRNQDGEITLRAIMAGARFSLSSRGFGVWLHHANAGSVSSRRDTFRHMKDTPEKLLGIQSDIIDEQLLRRSCAEHNYNNAMICARNGEWRAAIDAMKTSFALGFNGLSREHKGLADRLLPVPVLRFLTRFVR